MFAMSQKRLRASRISGPCESASAGSPARKTATYRQIHGDAKRRRRVDGMGESGSTFGWESGGRRQSLWIQEVHAEKKSTLEQLSTFDQAHGRVGVDRGRAEPFDAMGFVLQLAQSRLLPLLRSQQPSRKRKRQDRPERRIFVSFGRETRRSMPQRLQLLRSLGKMPEMLAASSAGGELPERSEKQMHKGKVRRRQKPGAPLS